MAQYATAHVGSVTTQKGGDYIMKATATRANVVSGVNLSLKASGANLFKDAFQFSKTIGKTVATKKGLRGAEAEEYAGQVQRALRRARIALEQATR